MENLELRGESITESINYGEMWVYTVEMNKFVNMSLFRGKEPILRFARVAPVLDFVTCGVYRKATELKH